MSRRLQKVLLVGAFVLLALAGDRAYVGEVARVSDMAFHLTGSATGGLKLPIRYVVTDNADWAFPAVTEAGRKAVDPALPVPVATAPAHDTASGRTRTARVTLSDWAGISRLDIRSPFVAHEPAETSTAWPTVRVLTRSYAAENPPSASSAEEPTIPLSVLVSMVGEDPWMGTLSPAEGNPFTHVIHQEAQPASQSAEAAPPAQSENSPGSPPSNPGDSTPPGDASTNTGETEPGSSSDPGSTVSSDEERPEAVLLISNGAGSVVALRANQESERQFRVDANRSFDITFASFMEPRDYSDYFIAEDFNQDGLTDLFRTSKTDGSYQLFLHSGWSWIPQTRSTLPFRPGCGTWLTVLDPSCKHLAFFNPQHHTLEILQAMGDGTFGSLMSFPLPGDYDGVAGVDFTQDGFDDLVLQNLSQNRANYLANAAGSGFRPLSANAPSFPVPVMGRFHPRPGQAKANFWLCQFGSQNLVYMVNRHGRAVPVLLFGDVDANTCLILADFDQNGTVDIGVGRIGR